MNNKVENNDLALNLDNISIEESEKIKSEMLRYRENRLSYILTLCALICSIIAAFIGLNSLTYNYATIAKVLMNIGILLFGFLFAEKAKAYSKSACGGLFVLGCISVARIAWAPFILYSGAPYSGILNSALEKAASDAGVEVSALSYDQINAVTNQVNTDNPFVSYCYNLHGLVVTQENHVLNWLPNSAAFRATFAMVFLIAAAALFISASVYGSIKSQKLSTYLNSLKDDKDLGGKR